MFVTLKAVAIGAARRPPKVQTHEMAILALSLEGLALSGLRTARCRSTAMAVKVNMDTLTDKI